MTFSFSSASYLSKNPADLFSHIARLQTSLVFVHSRQPNIKIALQNDFCLLYCFLTSHSKLIPRKGCTKQPWHAILPWEQDVYWRIIFSTMDGGYCLMELSPQRHTHSCFFHQALFNACVMFLCTSRSKGLSISQTGGMIVKINWLSHCWSPVNQRAGLNWTEPSWEWVTLCAKALENCILVWPGGAIVTLWTLFLRYFFVCKKYRGGRFFFPLY